MLNIKVLILGRVFAPAPKVLKRPDPGGESGKDCKWKRRPKKESADNERYSSGLDVNHGDWLLNGSVF